MPLATHGLFASDAALDPHFGQRSGIADHIDRRPPNQSFDAAGPRVIGATIKQCELDTQFRGARLKGDAG